MICNMTGQRSHIRNPCAQTLLRGLTVEVLPERVLWRVFGRAVQQIVQALNSEAAELLLTTAEQNHAGLQRAAHLRHRCKTNVEEE